LSQAHSVDNRATSRIQGAFRCHAPTAASAITGGTRHSGGKAEKNVYAEI